MPQMAPLSWLILFIIFSITLIIFSALNYFIFLPSKSSQSKTNNINKFSMNWKW